MAAAAAIQVTRNGTSKAILMEDKVSEFYESVIAGKYGFRPP